MDKHTLPEKDERDQQIETESKSMALEIVVAISQILTLICLIKGSSAWKLTLSILFFGCAANVFAQRKKFEEERPHIVTGLLFALGGLALVLWFFLG